MKVSKSDEAIKPILTACYPEWRGRKVSLAVCTSYQMSDYWSEGSRNYATAYHFDSGKEVEPSAACLVPFNTIAHARVVIPRGFAIVEHSIFCGKDAGVTIYVGADDLKQLLPGSRRRAQQWSARPGSAIHPARRWPVEIAPQGAGLTMATAMLTLTASSLFSKAGFNDGDMPDELLLWLVDVDGWSDDEAYGADSKFWHPALERLVRDHLLSAMAPAVVVIERIATCHNPIRIVTYDGRRLDYEDAPDVSVEVPFTTVADVLREVMRS